ncbi:MAG: hypothetical protein R2867_18150 [Caldilineaceae bacterium]
MPPRFGYSDSLISSLEKGQRLPDLAMVRPRFIPALGLQDDADTAARLIESAAAARGEQLSAPSPMTISRARTDPLDGRLSPSACQRCLSN